MPFTNTVSVTYYLLGLFVLCFSFYVHNHIHTKEQSLLLAFLWSPHVINFVWSFCESSLDAWSFIPSFTARPSRKWITPLLRSIPTESWPVTHLHGHNLLWDLLAQTSCSNFFLNFQVPKRYWFLAKIPVYVYLVLASCLSILAFLRLFLACYLLQTRNFLLAMVVLPATCYRLCDNLLACFLSCLLLATDYLLQIKRDLITCETCCCFFLLLVLLAVISFFPFHDDIFVMLYMLYV